MQYHNEDIQYFSVTQNLREINFGESRGSKIAVFAIVAVLNFVYLDFRITKVQKFIKIELQTSE